MTSFEIKAISNRECYFDNETLNSSSSSEVNGSIQAEGTEKFLSWSPRTPKKGAHPSPLPKPQTQEKKKPFPQFIFQMGGNYTYAHISPTNHHSFHGHLGGLQTSFEYKPPNHFYGAGFFSLNQGNIDGLKGSWLFQKIDIQERLGYSWYMPRKDRFFTLFSGLGYRHTGHNLKNLRSKIELDYNELYFPVGFIFLEKVNEITHLGLNFQWMPQVYPTLKVNPLKGARWILKSRYTNFKAQLPIQLNLWKKNFLALTLNPNFEYYQDGHTEAKTQTGKQLKLPGNTYLLAGIDINLGCTF